MTVNWETLDKLGRFLLRGLCNDWTGGWIQRRSGNTRMRSCAA